MRRGGAARRLSPIAAAIAATITVFTDELVGRAGPPGGVHQFGNVAERLGNVGRSRRRRRRRRRCRGRRRGMLPCHPGSRRGSVTALRLSPRTLAAGAGAPGAARRAPRPCSCRRSRRPRSTSRSPSTRRSTTSAWSAGSLRTSSSDRALRGDLVDRDGLGVVSARRDRPPRRAARRAGVRPRRRYSSTTRRSRDREHERLQVLERAGEAVELRREREPHLRREVFRHRARMVAQVAQEPGVQLPVEVASAVCRRGRHRPARLRGRAASRSIGQTPKKRDYFGSSGSGRSVRQRRMR